MFIELLESIEFVESIGSVEFIESVGSIELVESGESIESLESLGFQSAWFRVHGSGGTGHSRWLKADSL